MFFERFQQYWSSPRVPVKCCVRLSFILDVMTHHSCNHFGDRARPHEELVGITFHFLSVVGMVLCAAKDAWLGLTVSAQVSLLPVGLNMGCTSEMDASLRLSQARLSSSCFPEFSSAPDPSSALGIWTSSRCDNPKSCTIICCTCIAVTDFVGASATISQVLFFTNFIAPLVDMPRTKCNTAPKCIVVSKPTSPLQRHS